MDRGRGAAPLVGLGPDWTTPWVEVDLRVGGRYRLAMCAPGAADTRVVGGEYLQVDPPGRLVYTWAWESPGERMPPRS